MTTFVDLGMPVSLFAGDVSFAEGFDATGTCALCGARTACLPLDAVPVLCRACGREATLPARRREADCVGCGTGVALAGVLVPAVAEPLRLGVQVRLRGCVGCLRAGRWQQSHDTERGPVRPGHPPDGPWQHELAHTPRYATFQGERWLFCHDLPMIYLGEWGRVDFEAARPGAGRDLFAEIVTDVPPEDADAAWRHGLADHAGESDLRIYAFGCRRCEGRRAHTDCD